MIISGSIRPDIVLIRKEFKLVCTLNQHHVKICNNLALTNFIINFRKSDAYGYDGARDFSAFRIVACTNQRLLIYV